MKHDALNPQYYSGNTSLECIQVMECVFGEKAVVDFCLCNAFKYLWRYKNKNGVEDVQKAQWYFSYVRNKSLAGLSLEQSSAYDRVCNLLESVAVSMKEEADAKNSVHTEEF